MDIDTVVRALRKEDEGWTGDMTLYELHPLINKAADLIEFLQAQLTESQRRAQDARNELCLKCGRYHEAHNGACNGCRWKE